MAFSKISIAISCLEITLLRKLMCLLMRTPTDECDNDSVDARDI